MKLIYTSRAEMLVVMGENLREARLAMNISQQTAAERSGISLKAVRNLERGENASTFSLVALCRTLGKTDWIMNLAPPEIHPGLFEQRDPLHKRQRAGGSRKGAQDA